MLRANPTISTLCIILISLFGFQKSHAQCTGSGSIVTSGSGALGNPSLLDPDLDNDIVASGTTFSRCTGELAEFEALTNSSGCSTCQVPWTPLANSDIASDLWSGSGCGNTDIVGDTTLETNTFAYFTIVDPDGTCDSGDEVIVFRMRISDNFSGNFSFDFLVSNDGLTGANDPDGFVCCSKVTNAGFEYEVQLKTGGGAGVNVLDIDGQVNANNCGGAPDPCTYYAVSTNAQKSMACGSSCGCRTGGGNPVFLTFFVLLSDVGATCATYTDLTFVPVTSSSGNAVISSCTSVADIGGAADLSQALIDCPSCSGASYSGCTTVESEQGCVLACTAESNSFTTALPVTLTHISGTATNSYNIIHWQTSSEVNSSHFEVQRSLNGRDNFKTIGELPSIGDEFFGADYRFEDTDLHPIAYYRIKFVDYDGSYTFSNTIAIQKVYDKLKIHRTPSFLSNSNVLQYSTSSSNRTAEIIVSDLSGRIIERQQNISGGDRQTTTINTNHLSRGLYIISLSDGYSIVSEKFIF